MTKDGPVLKGQARFLWDTLRAPLSRPGNLEGAGNLEGGQVGLKQNLQALAPKGFERVGLKTAIE